MIPHAEKVVLLSQLRADEYISVDLDLDELDITASEKVATYQQIKDYIMKKYGVKVHTSYIAQTKRKYGFGMRENYNKSKKEKVYSFYLNLANELFEKGF